MRAPAQLLAVAVDLDDADRLGQVLLAEEHVGAERLRGLHRHELRVHGGIAADLVVHDALDLAQRLARRGGLGREVEAHALRADPRSGLLGLLAEHVAQRPMQQVRAGVVARCAPASRVVDLGADDVPNLQLAVERPQVHDRVTRALRVGHLQPPVGTDEHPAVTDLPATLGVERGAVEHDAGRLAGHHGHHPQLVGTGDVRVADEFGAHRRHLRVEAERPALLAARPLALLGHRLVEAGAVDAHATLRRHLDRQVDREAERVVEAERIGPTDDAPGRDQLVQASRPRLERAGELLLLGLDAIEDLVALRTERRIRLAHQVDDDVRGLAQERLGDTQQASVAHGTSDDAAQHVARTLIRWRHTLRQQERHRPRVIGHHLVAEPFGLDGVRVVTDELRKPLDDRHEQVGSVVRVDPLDNRGQPLEAGAGVDALERQRGQAAIGGAVELHEDQVPDLEPARAGLRVVRDAVRALGQVRAAIEVQLAARATRSGVAHPPEVLLVAGGDVAPAHDPLRWEADLVRPDRVRLVVIGVDGGGQALGRDAKLAGQEVPVPVDGLALEVVAEAPVAEHLEQRLVARRATDLLEVVVLARHPKADLRIDCAHVVAALLAGQDALERRHPRVHEQERRVVDGEQRRRGHAGMAALLEEALEALADLCRGHRLHRFAHRHSRREPATHRLSLLLGARVVRSYRAAPSEASKSETISARACSAAARPSFTASSSSAFLLST
jgi:hypothetical protein